MDPNRTHRPHPGPHDDARARGTRAVRRATVWIVAGAVGATGVATGLAAAETHSKATKGSTPSGQVPSESTTEPSLAPSIGSNGDDGDNSGATTTTTAPSYGGGFSTPSQPPTYSRHGRGSATSGGS